MPAAASTTNRMTSASSIATRAWSWTRSSMSRAGLQLEAAGVDHREVAAVPFAGAIDAVAGRAGEVLDDRHPLTDEPVEERGLADIRAADDGDDGEGRHGRGSVAAVSIGPMRIGIVGTRLAGVDGVTFETVEVGGGARGSSATSCGSCAGEVDALRPNARLIPPMHFTLPAGARGRRGGIRPDSDRPQCAARSSASPTSCCRRCATGRRATGSRRSSSRTPGPSRCTCRWASRSAIWPRRPALPAIGHHHDYWWERDRFAGCVVPEVLDAAFPPDLPNVAPREHQLACGGAAPRRDAAWRRRSSRTSSTSTSRARAARRAAMRAQLRASSAWASDAPARRPADAGRAAQGHRAGDRARRPAGGSGRGAAHHQSRRATRGSSTSSQLERLADALEGPPALCGRPFRAGPGGQAHRPGPLPLTTRTWPPT